MPEMEEYGVIIIIVALFLGIIGHFLIIVALAIPFILLHNADYLAAIVSEGKIINKSNIGDTVKPTEKLEVRS